MRFEVIINSAAFDAAVARQAKPIIDRKLTEIKAEMIEEFNAPKSGREYPRRNRASAPGEAPARQTGTLQASISEPRVGKVGRKVVGVLFIAAPYAGYLERGTPRIKPRPFVRPAIEEILRRRA